MLFIFLKAIYVLINAVIAMYDFTFYRIPNLLLGALLVLYGLSAPFYISLEGLITSLVVFAAVLGIGLLLYAAKVIGAGDAKYLAVVSIWSGFPGVVQLVFYVALFGGGIAILYLVLRDHIARVSDWVWEKFQKMEECCPIIQSVWMGSGQGPEKGKREKVDTRMVPYGIAIAAGAITMMLLHP